MAEVKTKVNDASVTSFLDSIEDEKKRKDTYAIYDMMSKATGAKPKMWGESIVGFDKYHYVGASGREGDWLLAGLSPRKQNLTLYVKGGWEQHDALLAKLGKHSLGMGCLYIRRLDDVNTSVLNKLIVQAVKRAKKEAKAEEKLQAKSIVAQGKTKKQV